MPTPWKRLVEAIPPLASYERDQLKESIERYGVRQPIIIRSNESEDIIDGHHRLVIAKELGVECPTISVCLDEDDAFDLGVSLNIDRRQLSTEQIRDVYKRKKEIALKLRQQGKTQEETAGILKVHRKTVDKWEDNVSNGTRTNAYNGPDLRVSIPKTEYGRIALRAETGDTQQQIAADYKVTRPRITQILQIVEARNQTPENKGTPSYPNKKYRCIVIDPPWQVTKIEREERPTQGKTLQYTTLSIEEIEKLPICELAEPQGCHIYLWATHKYLPDAFKIFESWNVKYQCLLTWVKPTGMTPFSWMYNTEHVLFGRIGSLDLCKLGLKLSFEAPITRHSEKPEAFYEKVREASPEPRLEMYQRKPHEGFDGWGNEVE